MICKTFAHQQQPIRTISAPLQQYAVKYSEPYLFRCFEVSL